MSDFFEVPPEPSRPPPRPPRPPWYGPPTGTLPGVIPLELVLAKSNRAAVYISRLTAYPSGFEVDVVTVSHPDHDDLDPALFGVRGRGSGHGEGLRFGVEFAGGAKATNVGGGIGVEPGTQPTGPVLHSGGGGGGGGGHWRASYWVWPLPPAGPLAFVCEWPVAGIPLTRAQLDARVVLDAARRALVLFEDGPRRGGGAAWNAGPIASSPRHG
jgi:hypothetical protein